MNFSLFYWLIISLQDLSPTGTLVRLLKHWYKEQKMQIKWGKHFTEPFHVSNGVRQGGVLSTWLFAVYLDDLSNELNNIKAGCYIGEVLLNHLMFADDICVFCPSARWLQRILDVCQAYAESHGIILNCNKTVCMTFEAKSAKSTATPVLKLGGQYGNSVDQYKCLGILLDIELSDDKDYQRQLRYQYYAANKLRASFSRSNAVKNVLFRSFCTPMYAFQLWCNFRKCMQISACRDCGWHIILVAELYTTCPGERVLVATKFIVTFLPLRLCYVNTSTCFSKDAENLTTYGYVLWFSPIVCTRHYSLNTVIAFYSVIEWSNFAVSVWSMACQATTLSHFTWTRPS